MTIEKVIEMIEDCSKLSNSEKEADKLKSVFIKNFKMNIRLLRFVLNQ